MIYRKSCILSNKKDLLFLGSFGKQPLKIGVTNENINKDEFFISNWYISKNSGAIQLNPLLDLKKIYETQHNEVVGEVWKTHHIKFSRFINNFTEDLGNFLEIGSGHGNLAKIHESKIQNKNKWFCLEPNPTFKGTKNIIIIKDFFKVKYLKKNISTIVLSHVLEHLYNPLKFLKSIANNLPDNGRVFISVPNLEMWINKKYTNSLSFEHTFYLNNFQMEEIAKLSGLKLIRKKKYLDHSIFYVYEKSKKIVKLNKNYFYKNRKIFSEYLKYFQDEVSKINKKLNYHKNSFMFGGHIFSQFLISFGLNEKKILFILDNSKIKQNKRLYGFNIYVKNPTIIKKFEKPFVIVKVGSYTKEISLQLKKINKEVILYK